MIRLTTLFVLILCITTTCIYAQTDPAAQKTEFAQLKSQADKFFLAGKYEQAKEYYEKAKQIPGNEFDDYLITQLENCERCLGFWRSIQELSKDPDALKVTMVIYEKILDINPKDSTVQGTLMNSYWVNAQQRYRQLDFQRAGELFRKVSGMIESPHAQEARVLADSSDYFANSMQNGFIAPEVDTVATYATGLKGINSVIVNNMKYPNKAIQDKVSGKVWVSFVVNEKGKVIPESVKVVRGIGSGCDEEAVRLIKLMNNWNPALKWGRPVRFQNTMSIGFSLNTQSKD
jgi:TonB family protein